MSDRSALLGNLDAMLEHFGVPRAVHEPVVSSGQTTTSQIVECRRRHG